MRIPKRTNFIERMIRNHAWLDWTDTWIYRWVNCFKPALICGFAQEKRPENQLPHHNCIFGHTAYPISEQFQVLTMQSYDHVVNKHMYTYVYTYMYIYNMPIH
jgi:hypothetical protein